LWEDIFFFIIMWYSAFLMDIRNIAIIAHVDHGKTTLTDAIMRQCYSLETTGVMTGGEIDKQQEEVVSMDSNQLEKERGITIYAKNTSVMYKGTKINIVDTPGHADFGSEVERVLRSIDSVLLLVDAQEGTMPQTRFVLKKSLELGLKPIVVINKIDKPASDPERTHDDVFTLMMELGATDEQLDFTTVYSISRQGIAKRTMKEESSDLAPLLDIILEKVPIASGKHEDSFCAQVFNLGYDTFLGRLAIARVYAGTVKQGATLIVKQPDVQSRTSKITKLFTFKGTERLEIDEITAGDIVMIAGISDATIGDTLVTDQAQDALLSIAVDEPTISLQLLVNDSPFAGRDGDFVTSRQIRERLERELEVNVGLRIIFDEDGKMMLYGRGELHIAVLLEVMRREGYEMQVSQPHVITKEIDGEKTEPWEEAVIDVPNESSGVVIEKLTRRRGVMVNIHAGDIRTRIVFEIPTRGLMGYRSQFIIDTRGEGILSSRVVGFRKLAGVIETRDVGSMISRETGSASAFALWGLQERGLLYIEPGMEVYIGEVIGNTSKGDEMLSSPTKGKQLSNVRASGTDEAITLKPAFVLTIERGLEVMNDDEYLEITPLHIRLRKKLLTETERARATRSK